MPAVPERPLSRGEQYNKKPGVKAIICKTQQEKKDSLYWRYKKNEAPGEVSLQAFKCSKCDFVGVSKSDFNNHWTLEH